MLHHFKGIPYDNVDLSILLTQWRDLSVLVQFSPFPRQYVIHSAFLTSFRMLPAKTHLKYLAILLLALNHSSLYCEIRYFSFVSMLEKKMSKEVENNVPVASGNNESEVPLKKRLRFWIVL